MERPPSGASTDRGGARQPVEDEDDKFFVRVVDGMRMMTDKEVQTQPWNRINAVMVVLKSRSLRSFALFLSS